MRGNGFASAGDDDFLAVFHAPEELAIHRPPAHPGPQLSRFFQVLFKCSPAPLGNLQLRFQRDRNSELSETHRADPVDFDEIAVTHMGPAIAGLNLERFFEEIDMNKAIGHLSVVALCMGIGIASSDAKQPARPAKGAELNDQIERSSTCWVDENGYAIDQPPAGQMASFVQEGSQAGPSVCGPDGWSHPVASPPANSGSGSLRPAPGHKPVTPGAPIEGELAPGSLDRSEFNKFMDEASTAADQQREERRRRRAEEDEGIE